MGAKIHVSVLCPGWVNTGIWNSEKNRQIKYRDPGVDYNNEGKREKYRLPRKMIEKGMSPERVADKVFDAIDKKDFYIFPQPEIKELIKERFNNLFDNQMPLDLSIMKIDL